MQKRNLANFSRATKETIEAHSFDISYADSRDFMLCENIHKQGSAFVPEETSIASLKLITSLIEYIKNLKCVYFFKSENTDIFVEFK